MNFTHYSPLDCPVYPHAYKPPTRFSVNDDTHASLFSKEDIKQVQLLGDAGLLFVGDGVMEGVTEVCFGVRYPGAKGPVPFTSPASLPRNSRPLPWRARVLFSTRGGLDTLDACAAQQWAVLQAYRLGLKHGKDSK